MEYTCTSTKIWIKTWMKELNHVFLEKSEVQLLGPSPVFELFGVSSL